MKKIEFNLETIIGDYSIGSGHHGVKYKGIDCVKCPFDYVMYQMILNEVKPDLVIEIGTYNGGSALYISDIISEWGGVIHTIDIVEKSYHPLVSNKTNIKTFFDGYQGYDISNTNGFNKILIIEDGSHIYDDVISAFNKFNKLVSKDSYFIIEDGVIYFTLGPDSYNGGPVRAIDEIMENNNEYIVDRKWCDFFGINATFNTNGFLKKIS